MKKINELNTQPHQKTEEEVIQFINEVNERLRLNGIEVRKALAILEAELAEKQNAPK